MAPSRVALLIYSHLAAALAAPRDAKGAADGAITESNDRRVIAQLFRVVPEGGNVTIPYSAKAEESMQSNPHLGSVPRYTRLVMEVGCQLIVSIEIHAWIHLRQQLEKGFEPDFEKRLAETLEIKKSQVTVRVLQSKAKGKDAKAKGKDDATAKDKESTQHDDGLFHILVSVRPMDEDASATWLAESSELQSKVSDGLFWLEGPHGNHDLLGEAREALHGVFGDRQEVKILRTTQHSHTKPCDTGFHTTGSFKVDHAHNASSLARPITMQNHSTAQITYDVCSSPLGKLEAQVTLESTDDHRPMAANITAAVIAVDTRPYSAICPDLSMPRTGHTLTRVGPYMVMFGGLAVLPGTDKAVPVSELWIMREQIDTGQFEWESLDRTHNIFTRPHARYGHVAAGTSDGLFVIFGGHTGKNYLHDLWAIRLTEGDFDHTLQDEVSFPPFHWRRCYSSVRHPKASLMMSSAMVAHGEKLVVFGGQDPHGSLSSEFWSLELAGLVPGAVHWQQIWPYKVIAPTARFGHSMCEWPSRPWRALHRAGSIDSFRGRADQGGLLVFGGSELDFDSLVLRNDLWYFDLATNHWISLEMGAAEVPGVGPGARARPPPLAFHSATGLGTAMVVVGGISVEVGLTETGYRFRVCNEIWRWMDEDGWSLQFTSAKESGSSSIFKHISLGAMAYWPEIGKLLLYGGQSDASAWTKWMHQILRVQRSQEARVHNAQGPLFAPAFFPAFLTHVQVDSIKSDILVLEAAACTETAAKVCLPCSSGATIERAASRADVERQSSDRESSDSDVRPEQQVPWIDDHARQCIPCRAGTIFDRGRCLPCPLGFFGTFKGMESWKMCWPCGSDMYSDETGSRSCTPCPLRVNETLFGNEHELSREEQVQQEAGRRDDSEDDTAEDLNDFELTGRNCPIFSQSPSETLNHQLVHEANQPHGDDSEEMHLWWQERAVLVWICVLGSAFVVLLVYQARRPRSTSRLLRRIDMRPITGQPVFSEAGGVMVIFYLVTCSCLAAVGVAHHLLHNSQLTSMSIPAQEESRSVGQIAVDLLVSATLVGYTGPCLAHEDIDGPWREDDARDVSEESDDSHAAERSLADAIPWNSELRWQPERQLDGTAHTGMQHATPELQSNARRGDDLWVQEETVASGHVADAVRGHSFLMAPAQPRKALGSLFSSVLLNFYCHKGVIALASSWLRYWRLSWLDSQSPAEEGLPRRLSDSHCHRLVTVNTAGLDVENRSDLVTTCSRVDNRQCRVSLTCPSCSLKSQDARIVLDVANGYAFTATREIHWEVKTKWLLPSKLKGTADAYSSVKSIVTSGDRNRCMRGPKPSIVRITLVPTDYKDLLGASHLYGFVAQFVEADQGSVTDPRYFHRELPQLQSIVELHASHSFYKLVLSKKRTTYDFLTQMLGFLSGMSLIARVSVAVWLNIDVRSRRSIACFRGNAMLKAVASVVFFWVPEEEEEDEDECGNGEQIELAAQPVLHSNKSLKQGGYQQVLQHADSDLGLPQADSASAPCRRVNGGTDGTWRDVAL